MHALHAASLLTASEMLSSTHRTILMPALMTAQVLCAELQTISNQELRWLQRHASSSGGM